MKCFLKTLKRNLYYFSETSQLGVLQLHRCKCRAHRLSWGVAFGKWAQQSEWEARMLGVYSREWSWLTMEYSKSGKERKEDIRMVREMVASIYWWSQWLQTTMLEDMGWQDTGRQRGMHEIQAVEWLKRRLMTWEWVPKEGERSDQWTLTGAERLVCWFIHVSGFQTWACVRITWRTS